MKNNSVKHPCQGCVYYVACGESNRTQPCDGRKTKKGENEYDNKRVAL